ncbi:haspin protein kinase [Aspergillus indologenus CBS 114.80]|uniref:non-specific serine/threonine protein kinase n=1 Tax=Aspergillus indologenus CBS 114.80 TaxID=1450541 RepID=A0A2V5J0N5_9EURO|nr:haspin protein kinase [Aspergillus indologenus CBS 114.80]
MFPPSSPVAATGDQQPWVPRAATRTRTVAQRKVYGKRRADAPRAVLDQRSPAKAPEWLEPKKHEKESGEDAVEGVRVKLAEVAIEEKSTPIDLTRKGKAGKTRKTASEDRPEVVQSVEEKEVKPTSAGDRPVRTSKPQDEPENDEHAQVQLKDTDTQETNTCQTAKPRYDTMVEVRISPRTPTERTRRRNKTCEAFIGSETIESETRTSRRNKDKPMARVSSGCVTDEKANEYVRPILNEALSVAAAQSVQKFDSWAGRAGNMLEVVKIAEGSYGEVYKLRLREEVCKKEMSRSKLARLKAYGDGVFKVVPLRAQSGPGSKKFTSIDEIVSEVKMLKYLDPIPGFARFREIHVVQGRFPDSFQKAWDHYKKTKDDCWNPNPSSKRAYPDSQLWAIVEMDDAGCELEKFAWTSIFQIYDIFWGVAMALARAEEYALFEHRDLHLGNVCIRSTRPGGCMDPPTNKEIMHQSYKSGFGLSSLETTIIDYSLSRAQLHLSEAAEAFEIASSDLDKKQIFDAIGRDEDEIMLRNTYRYMRAQLYHGDPLKTEKCPDIAGIWAEYAPRTNLVWLLFLLQSLLKNRKPEGPSLPAPRQPLAPCSPNKGLKPAAASKKNTLKPQTPPTVTPVHADGVLDLKQTLEKRLTAVLELLDLEHGHEDMCCAADLVAYAIDSQWLDEQDFF